MPSLPLKQMPTIARISKYMLIDQSRVTFQSTQPIECYEFKVNGYLFQITYHQVKGRCQFTAYRDNGLKINKLGCCSIPTHSKGSSVCSANVEIAIKNCCGYIREELVRLAQQ